MKCADFEIFSSCVSLKDHADTRRAQHDGHLLHGTALDSFVILSLTVYGVIHSAIFRMMEYRILALSVPRVFYVRRARIDGRQFRQ